MVKKIYGEDTTFTFCSCESFSAATTVGKGQRVDYSEITYIFLQIYLPLLWDTKQMDSAYGNYFIINSCLTYVNTIVFKLISDVNTIDMPLGYKELETSN